MILSNQASRRHRVVAGEPAEIFGIRHVHGCVYEASELEVLSDVDVPCAQGYYLGSPQPVAVPICAS